MDRPERLLSPYLVSSVMIIPPQCGNWSRLVSQCWYFLSQKSRHQSDFFSLAQYSFSIPGSHITFNHSASSDSSWLEQLFTFLLFLTMMIVFFLNACIYLCQLESRVSHFRLERNTTHLCCSSCSSFSHREFLPSNLETGPHFPTTAVSLSPSLTFWHYKMIQASQKKDILRWMNLEVFLPNEISKSNILWLHFHKICREESHQVSSRSVMARGWWQGVCGKE